MGYGYKRIGKKRYRVHRLAYEDWYGPIPKGMMVLHKCDNRKCYNPEHLFLGTAKDNAIDMVNKGRHNAGKGNSKLTEEQVKEIRDKYIPWKYPTTRLAKEYDVDISTIHYIVHGKTWRNVA